MDFRGKRQSGSGYTLGLTDFNTKINEWSRRTSNKSKLRLFIFCIVLLSVTAGYFLSQIVALILSNGGTMDYETYYKELALKRPASCPRMLDMNYVESNFGTLGQKDPQLVQYVRARHLTPPSKLEYDLKRTEPFKDELTDWIINFFVGKRDGIFIDNGVGDGETLSRTLLLEKDYGWKGLIVECNPLVLPFLKLKHRKAWIVDSCLSPKDTPTTVSVTSPTGWSFSPAVGEQGNSFWPTSLTLFEREALPLYTVISALNWKEVDYLNLEYPGKDLSFFKTFPFDSIVINVLSVDTTAYSEVEINELRSLLQNQAGFSFVKQIKLSRNYMVYVHKSIQSMI